MKKIDRLLTFGWGLCIISLVASTVGLVSRAAFVKKSDEKTGLNGDVGLRNYYQKGSGTLYDPFVISRPIHLYNLSRLQALGLYSDPSSPKYFQLGYDPNGGSDYGFYRSDSSSEMGDYLDMSAYDGSTESKTVHPIGSEAFPFCGKFIGNNMQVSNLHVFGDPQDVGVFGYTYSGSKVENVLFDNLTITVRGYDNEAFGDLFASSISPNIVVNKGGVQEEVANSSSFTLASGENLSISFVEPIGSQYVTQISPSSEYFRVSTDHKTLSLNRLGTYDDSHNAISVFDLFSSYQGSYPAAISDRISVVAHKIAQGVPTARVVSVYNATFSKTSESSAITLSIAKANQEDHGCNVGFIIGHCNGSLSNAYVHNGVMDINHPYSGYSTLPQKSEYGLIGLIGSSVNNSYKGTSGTAGVEGNDNGVVDFSAVYDDIVDENANFTMIADNVYTFVPRSETAYMDYLRYQHSGDAYRYTYAPNTVSLRGRSAIRDSLEKDYGLGVFTIVTDTMTSGNGATYYNENLDKCMIEKESAYQDIYYVTAEWQNTNLDPASSWNEYQQGAWRVHPGYVIPKDFDSESNANYEKNVNFIFKTRLDGESSRFYFADADSTSIGGNYLTEYFHSKLVDANGNPISKTSASRGVMIKDKSGNNIASFSSSLHLPNQSNDDSQTLHYMVDPDNDEKTLISRTVNFSIKAEKANVTVVVRKASNQQSNSAQVGIYRVNNINRRASLLTDRDYSRPDYAMYIPSDSNFAYFDYQNGKVGNSELGYFQESQYANIAHTNSSTTGKLFAHTFCLPKGDYAIAVPSSDCYLHYVCAQGQDEGDFGTAGVLTSIINTIELVDFVKAPIYKEQDGSIIQIFSFDHPELSRCFLSLDQAHVSHFKSGHLELDCHYDDSSGDYYIVVGGSGQEAQIQTMSVINYAKNKMTVHLIDIASSEQTIAYPSS